MKDFKHAIVLGGFSLVFGIMLAVTGSLTASAIVDRAMEDRLNSLAQVLPANLHDNNPVKDAVSLKNAEGKEIIVYRAMKEGKVTGVAYEVQGSGYGGSIKLMMGIDLEGRLLGVRVTSHKETPGLGDRMEEKKGDWILRFTGLSLGNPPIEKWKVKKDGGQFDQFAGATITPRAVVGAVRGGMEFFASNKTQMMEMK
ncbi:MAG: electron transport complex subunit RsxG [Rhodocyclaceae bacterium]|nr:MAG: electron transport complex subunit RsxG [Rhodocyclaceae bacterium]